MPTDYKLAAAYIRVSTEDQVELFPASQLVEIRKWAASHGYIVPDENVYTDEGITSQKVVGRDAFRRMIDAVMYKSILRKQLGIEVKDAQQLLDHSRIDVTLDTYTHIRRKHRGGVADKLNKAD